MNKLIQIASFMCILSMITLGSTVTELVLNLVLAAILWVVGYYLFQLVQKINMVYEYMIQSKEQHSSFQKELQRVDGHVNELEHEVREQLSELNEKVDRILGTMQTK